MRSRSTLLTIRRLFLWRIHASLHASGRSDLFTLARLWLRNNLFAPWSKLQQCFYPLLVAFAVFEHNDMASSGART